MESGDLYYSSTEQYCDIKTKCSNFIKCIIIDKFRVISEALWHVFLLKNSLKGVMGRIKEVKLLTAEAERTEPNAYKGV
ncbi:hypothetical protein TNCT_157181 [Trichonephila clavata]|uniref:Uncharacterized protein n=1 Tax=Trichonephila clavata TaxID=2740835 RepID=A0A8X6FHF2_TRICU|nr:hypothetical protein TNCT_157181 [Trichonephila clavata]